MSIIVRSWSLSILSLIRVGIRHYLSLREFSAEINKETRSFADLFPIRVYDFPGS